MSITLLFACCQIETSVRDLDAARAFMQRALGAAKIEQPLARQIESLFPHGGYRVDHLDCGQAMYQLNEPSPSIVYRGQQSIHQRYLDRIGNCVTNLNYFVDDAEHAQALLTGLGAPIHLQGPSSAAASLADYGPENTRAGADTRQFYFLGSRDLIGFDLELMEPNFRRFSQQTVQYPCFVHPRPLAGDDNLELLRLRIVVPDLRRTYANLCAIFAPASRSKPYAVAEGAEGEGFRIGLGGMEIEYCQPPPGGTGYLAEQLANFGPGVIAAVFAARDMERALHRVRESGVSIRDSYRVPCRTLIGFDVVFEPRPEGLSRH